VDNNIILNINGEGVYLCDTDNTIVAHNLFSNIIENQVVAKVKTDRSLGGRRLTSTGNQIVNNIIVDQGKPILTEDPSNVTDYNIYIATISGKSAMKDSGKHSVLTEGNIKFDKVKLVLNLEITSQLPEVPLLKNCELDFFKTERIKDHNLPGPFQGLVNPVALQLFDKLHMDHR
jgi:parallel beta-helix repeat protein